MKTTIDIPDKDLEDVISFTHARTKREAILTAVHEYNQRARMRALTKVLGSFDDLMTVKELERMRSAETEYK